MKVQKSRGQGRRQPLQTDVAQHDARHADGRTHLGYDQHGAIGHSNCGRSPMNDLRGMRPLSAAKGRS
jgi:hypothetical protein